MTDTALAIPQVLTSSVLVSSAPSQTRISFISSYTILYQFYLIQFKITSHRTFLKRYPNLQNGCHLENVFFRNILTEQLCLKLDCCQTFSFFCFCGSLFLIISICPFYKSDWVGLKIGLSEVALWRVEWHIYGPVAAKDLATTTFFPLGS